MKKHLLPLVTAMSLLLVSCKKELATNSTNGMSLMSGSISNEYIFGPDNTSTDVAFVELGRQYAPVFNVENVRNAWNALSSKKITRLDPTHKYVKFTPQDPAELNNLVNSHIPIYTFPLDHEIIKAGDYMRDLSLEPNGIPAFYTYLPSGRPVPDCKFDLLDEVYLLDLRSVVAEKAFELAGESEVYPNERNEDDIIPSELLTTDNELTLHIGKSSDWGPFIRDFDLGTLILPEPVGNPAQEINTPPSTVSNSCSCGGGINHQDVPRGCIRVEETQWWNGAVRFEGVNDVAADFFGTLWATCSCVYKSRRLF